MRPTNSKGFTLFEILITTFIFAVVLSLLYTSYIGTFRNIEATESQADIYGMARITLERMVEDLGSVYVNIPPSDGFMGEDAEINGRNADTIRFLSRAHIIFNEDDRGARMAEIVYYIKESEEEDAFILYRSDTPEFEEGPEEGTGGLILCDGLFSVNFTYYTNEGEEYESWDSTKDEFKGRVPAMVSIVLEFFNRSNPEAPFKFKTGVALPMARNSYGKTS
ncbi:MAG: prepilin-type N-terminal cleavage/methylation domain-containing protein [Desulfobacteraceae bacterium]|nr:prepilin-type N-terminal cleavage/methylation domain-containing protein [Desulfobacteraceae bacterium]